MYNHVVHTHSQHNDLDNMYCTIPEPVLQHMQDNDQHAKYCRVSEPKLTPIASCPTHMWTPVWPPPTSMPLLMSKATPCTHT